ncbi:aspartate carbamoyltransferase [Candidatus Saccharibacteria bacterium]|nr:aspartate carbamoyltransferase [Candidatus Saccharibacteria bacterium]
MKQTKSKINSLKEIVTIKQFQDKQLLNEIFTLAKNYKELDPGQYPKSLEGKVVATIFYEPSTRTRLSFEAATLRLGGEIISTENAGQFSSAAKGETLEDSIRTLNGYADAIVLRHPEIGAAERAADVSGVPIINAGDGAGEHPTQALLDLFTIIEAKGKVDGLKIGLVGDLLNGRTIHSLIQLLSVYDVELYCIAPDKLQLPKKYIEQLEKDGIECHLFDEWDGAIDKVDVLYVTRVQKERFDSVKEYDAIKDSFILDAMVMKNAKKDTVVMHPLPRVNEINPDVDNDPRAIYFEQAQNGLFVRMALLTKIIS